MYVLGVDIGTTSTKAMLADERGRVAAASGNVSYPLLTPGEGRVEQRAQDWWDTFVKASRECLGQVPDPEAVKAVSFSTQGGSIVFTDGKGEPLSNASVWMDGRGRDYLPDYIETLGERHVYHASGWRIGGAMAMAKLPWYREHEPRLLRDAKKLLTTADYVSFKLTGRYTIDGTNAAMTQLYNIQTEDWDETILDAAGISRDLLPEPVRPGEPLGTLTEEAAAALGLPRSVLVVAGAHDQYCAATGSGALNDGDILLSTGTAWVALGISEKLIFDDEGYIGVGRHVLPGLYGALVSVPTAGVGLEWLRNGFAPQRLAEGELTRESFAMIDREAAGRRQKAKELYFYPHFGGSGYPRWSRGSRSSLMGLRLEHDFYDVALAVMEGVAFDVNLVLEAFAEKGMTGKRLKLLGGASKSPLWTEIVSAVTGLPIDKYTEANVACMGAACLAGTGCGMFPSVREAAATIASYERLEAPAGELRRFYKEKYEGYKRGLDFVEEYYHI